MKQIEKDKLKRLKEKLNILKPEYYTWLVCAAFVFISAHLGTLIRSERYIASNVIINILSAFIFFAWYWISGEVYFKVKSGVNK